MVTEYRHTSQSSQAPDDQPGAYYVSVKDGSRYGLLLGPFIDAHHGALLLVPFVQAKAEEEVEPRAAFYAFGTCRLPKDGALPYGRLNKFFGLPHV